MKYARPWLLGAALSLTATLVCPAYAHAESGHSPEEALVFQEQGRKEVAAKHYEQAAVLFEKAHAVLHNPVTALDLMMAYGYLEKNVEAVAIGKEIQHNVAKPTEPAPHKEARKQIAEAMEALNERISALVLRFHGAKPPGLVVSLDGKTLRTDDLDKPVRVNRGHHVIFCAAPGFVPKTITHSVLAKTSEEFAIPILMDPGPVVATRTSTPAADSTSTANPPLLPWILFGSSAVAAVGLGIGAGVVYQSMEEAWTSPVCGQACLEFNDRRPALTALSISSMAVGAISLGTLGFALYKTFQKPEKNPTAYFVPATNGGSFVVRW